MLAGAESPELYAELFDYVEDEDAKQALALLVGLSAALRGPSVQPQKKGVVRDFRFIVAGEMPFAFIPNKHWLLFYFRLPAVRSGKYDLDTLKSAFDGVNVNGTGEWTVRLRSIADVRRLWALLNLN